MTLHVIEINDLGIRVSDESGLLLCSPGIAHIEKDESVFGKEAQAQLRLDPLNCHHQFWSSLSVDPFKTALGNFRHQADLVFTHLQEIANEMSINGDVLLSVPGTLNKEQLGVLLGLSQYCPFNAVGLVDSAVAACASLPAEQATIYVDLQLHEISLCRLENEKGSLSRKAVQQLPALGWLAISDSLLQYINSCFIQQNRFNPQHDAEAEQYLFETLPEYLEEASAALVSTATGSDEQKQESQTISLLHNEALQQIRISSVSLAAKLQKVYAQLEQKIAMLNAQRDASVVLAPSIQRLPGLVAYLREAGYVVAEVQAQALAQQCLSRWSDIVSRDAMRLVSSIEVEAPLAPLEPVSAEGEPSHILAQHEAIPLGAHLVLLSGGHHLRVESNFQESTQDKIADIRKEEGQLFIDPTSDQLKLNGKPIVKRMLLQLGDNISFAQSKASLSLIRVRASNE